MAILNIIIITSKKVKETGEIYFNIMLNETNILKTVLFKKVTI